ncbi:ATP-binding protein [uncultured Campylobacter sp.]|uniref:ATP-binding protein n=1 Tax=uncultured Campylobacter sp. TaxID=218934 RepID=UPI0026331195|nr:ATP-binding protein [uncultured Campylobacter sp.]
MKKVLLSCALAGALFGLEIDGFSAPSGSLITDDAFYIANRGSSEDPQERDGFISRIVKNSGVVETNFIDDLVNPGGMAQIADVLYVCDIDTIRGFTKGEEVFNLKIEGAQSLGDITTLGSEVLLASDPSRGTIWRIDLLSRVAEEFARIDPSLGSPNGLLAKGERLLITTFDPAGKTDGRVLSMDLKSREISIFADMKGVFYGIARGKDGEILISDWGENLLSGKIWRIDANGQIRKINLGAMQRPADISSDGKVLLIPKTLENKVELINLP